MLKPTPSRSFLHVSNEINAVLGIQGHLEMFTYAKVYALLFKFRSTETV